MNPNDLYKKLVEELNSGTWRQGDRLPSMRDLAKRFDTSLRKIHVVMKMLEEQNLVTRGARKKGTFVGGNDSMTGARKALKRTGDQVLALFAETTFTYINWNKKSFQSLAEGLSDVGLAIVCEAMPSTPEKLREILENPGKNTKCVVLLPDGDTGEMLNANRDILLNAPIDVFCYQYGNFPCDRLNCHIVSVDNARDGMQAADYLLKKGYTDFTFVQELHNAQWSRLRFEEFQLRVKREPASIRKILTEDNWLEKCLKIAQKHPQNHVFVCVTDNYPVKMMEFFAPHGLKIGEDFKTFSFNDDLMAESYGLTTMRPPVSKIGHFLAKFIARQMSEHNDDRRLTYRLCSDIIERQSC